MGTVSRTKKGILAVTITTALALTGLQAAVASPGAMKGPGPQGPCPMQSGQLDAETVKARDTFLTETTELRKGMAEKRAAMRALMNSNTPDQAQASKLAGELFDLREQIRTKAQAAGLPPQMMMAMGKMGCGNAPMTGARHHGGHQM